MSHTGGGDHSPSHYRGYANSRAYQKYLAREEQKKDLDQKRRRSGVRLRPKPKPMTYRCGGCGRENPSAVDLRSLLHRLKCVQCGHKGFIRTSTPARRSA